MSNATVNTQQQAAGDAYDDAMSDKPISLERVYFGEVTNCDVWYCMLEKGVGKRAFDATRDDPGDKRTAIKLQISVEKRDGGSYTVDQDVINTAPEWQKFTLPSLRALALDLRTLRGRFVQLTRKPTGESYVNKSQEKKDRTAIVFDQVFADQLACKAAAEAYYGSRGGHSNGNGNGHADAGTSAPAAPAQAQAPVSNQERQFAKDSLAILWQASAQNEQAFLAMLAANPTISKHFGPDSDEVKNVMLPF